jgi:hypothetical protein
MSLESTITRIGQIESLFSATPASAPTSANTAAQNSSGTSATTFADQLQAAAQSSLTDPTSAATATNPDAGLQAANVPAALSGLYGGQATGTSGVSGASGPSSAAAGGGPAMVSIAATQIGQAEQPDGSNNGPAISTYRTATTGAMAGEPWCAYFVSWVARQAGTPLGDQGQGFGAVSQIWSWAQEHGRAITNGPGVVPQPGDLIVFGGQHVGIVDKVLPNGDIQTIEGNYSNKVSQVVRSPTEATGYVRMG